MKETLRRILSELGCLDVPLETISDRTDLNAVGLSSLATVHLMLAIERDFAVKIPDSMLNYRLFSSIDSMAAAITQVQRAQATA
jgi:acyl carrier protein